MAEDSFQERRRALRRRRWGGRMARTMLYAVIAEAFLIPLAPLAAMAALLLGCAALLLR
ncbi:MAG: polymerase, partial [Centipeda sp. (in: firmicutes)]